LNAEIRHIQLTETSRWQIAIRSKEWHHDDITNATMTSTYVITHEKLSSSIRFRDEESVGRVTSFSDEYRNTYQKYKKLPYFQNTNSNKTFL
jgi:hypothetical protein